MILKHILEESKKKKTIISARKYNDGKTIYVGYILDFNDSIFMMQQVSKNGLEDGIYIDNIENIESFELRDYEQAYQFLFENSFKLSDQKIKYIDLPNSENWKFELIKLLFSLNDIVSIKFNNDDYVTGYILNYDEVNVNFKCYNDVGIVDGIIIYKIEDFCSFNIDDFDIRRTKLFINWRENKIQK